MISSNESDDSAEGLQGSRKRKRNPKVWKDNKRKTAALKGEAYVSTSGKRVAPKSSGSPCGCKEKCTEKFPMKKKTILISKLYDGRPKNERDTFLQGLIEVTTISRRRGRVQANAKPKSASFKYSILESSGNRVAVCKRAFMSIYGVSHMQIQRLTTLLVTGASPRDLRGLHNNRPRSKSDEVLIRIREHIERFPRKSTHYSSRVHQYLDARLNVKTMHSLFIKENPDLQHDVKYEFYLKYFKENYALKFGRPQVDVCSECERLGAKIKSKDLNDNAKRVATAELIVHKRRAKKFYNKLQDIQKLCQNRPEVAGITLDYIQNLPLPNIPVQEIFYFRQLWVYALEIHNLSDNSGHFYTYHEGHACKGPNEVCTFLKNYIETHIP
ncbi:unnamed protein product [Acanthoscelides obtectus]|uniref:Uncharacterized protein n=1 Tax=Acanthoscelides obtectus TaxID=200917 RepID=A0A9P0P377_ACAOB|nr:unnamed protein product [Acanthoscelides obtectus]CAK1631101.1 hypothetical protein AOBTE_LOCUS6756 [Acanthoscelides obtectus]